MFLQKQCLCYFKSLGILCYVEGGTKDGFLTIASWSSVFVLHLGN